MLIGLDCAEPELIFDRWLDELPNLKSLYQQGVHGRSALLRSADHGPGLVGHDVLEKPGPASAFMDFATGPTIPTIATRSPTRSRSRKTGSGKFSPARQTFDRHRRAGHLSAQAAQRPDGDRFSHPGHQLRIHPPAGASNRRLRRSSANTFSTCAISAPGTRRRSWPTSTR